MKSLVVLGLVLMSGMAHAELISTKTVNLPVDLTTAGIRLSNSGYISSTVKVLIPELAAVTTMNHRNDGETAPCVATFETSKVEDVVKGNPSIEVVPFTIQLERSFWRNENICRGTLTETVTANIRGFNFEHIRWIVLPERHIDDCK